MKHVGHLLTFFMEIQFFPKNDKIEFRGYTAVPGLLKAVNNN